MGEFNSDDHYIYYCGQESLRRSCDPQKSPDTPGSLEGRQAPQASPAFRTPTAGSLQSWALPWERELVPLPWGHHVPLPWEQELVPLPWGHRVPLPWERDPRCAQPASIWALALNTASTPTNSATRGQLTKFQFQEGDPGGKAGTPLPAPFQRPDRRGRRPRPAPGHARPDSLAPHGLEHSSAC